MWEALQELFLFILGGYQFSLRQKNATFPLSGPLLAVYHGDISLAGFFTGAVTMTGLEILAFLCASMMVLTMIFGSWS